MKIGLLGFGVVGRGVYELTRGRDDMQVVKVLRREDMQLPDAKTVRDIRDIVEDDSIDTVVEVMGGLHPAYDYVRAAIEAGKSVVTANKALVCTFYDELLPLVKEKGVLFRCTAAVGGGIGCGGCAAGKGCVFGGVVNEAIEKAKTADAFVFGTPVHYASASGNMTSFMDRLAYAGGRYLAYKPAAICCSARRAGTTTTLDQLVKYPQFFHMPLVNGSYWAMVHGSNAEQVLEDAEGCAVMQELGRNMAWMLHCIESGKAAGFDHPQNPPRPMTNFIR